MSLITRISDLTTRVATEFKNVKNIIAGNTTGNLTSLTTSVKTSILAAINSLKSEVDGKQPNLGYTAENSANKGQAGGYAPLGADAKVPAAHLPSYVDDIIEIESFNATAPTVLANGKMYFNTTDNKIYTSNGTAWGTGATPESGKIYTRIDTNVIYRFSGTTMVEISASLALGETSTTAYRGDRGKIAYDHSQLTAHNPHNTTFAQLGSKPTTIAGFGITDAYTKTEIGNPETNFVTQFEGAL